MPRRARRDLESLYLHVIVQGIERKYIFDKEMYKKELKNKCFKEQRKIEVQKCSTDDEYVKECIRLKEINISNRKIAESLKIGRNKVNKIIKNMCQ